METINVRYENEPVSGATEYLMSTGANKKWLNTAMTEAKNGKGVEISLDDLWK